MLLTIGGDMRYAHLTRLADDRNLDIHCIGLENSPFPLPHTDLHAVSRADAVILPNPWRSGMSLPLAAQKITLNDIFSLLRPDALVLLSDTACIPALSDHIKWIDLSQDEQYILSNAHLTAEGALSIAMKHDASALMGSVCLVIGYGRIARRLAQLLHVMGAEVHAAARREEVRRQIKSDGIHAHSLDNLSSVLPNAHFIFSTPPASVLDSALLRQISPDALLMDLASPPFGFDLTQARTLGLCASRENGLPGRYAPRSAGAILLEAVLRTVEKYTDPPIT